jgi:hypothetical protein
MRLMRLMLLMHAPDAPDAPGAGIDREMQLGLLNLLKLAVKGVLLAGTVAVTAPWMLVVGVPTLAGCVWVQRAFQKGCLQVRRLLAMARSPMFAHFAETLGGLQTIRAFGQQQSARTQAFFLADQWMRTMMSLIGCMGWLKVRLNPFLQNRSKGVLCATLVDDLGSLVH